MSPRTEALRAISKDLEDIGRNLSASLVSEAAHYIESIEGTLRSYQRAYGLIEEDEPDMRENTPFAQEARPEGER